VPSDEEVPMPPDGYIISIMPFHKSGLLHHYGIKL
jgi:hypothetical protein